MADDDRFVSTQFCDDIRQEVGNKYSLVGCYTGPLIVVQPLPAVLPKLCAAVRVYTPISRPLRKLVVRIFRGEMVIGEVPFDCERPPSWPLEKFPGARWQTVGAMTAISPFAIESPCMLRVEVETEEEMLHGGCIWIGGSETTDSTVLTTAAGA